MISNVSDKPTPVPRGVRYAKSLLIQYFIDIDIFKNVLINIDIFKNVLINVNIDIDIFRTGHIDIDIDIDSFQIVDTNIFKKFLSTISSILICLTLSYQYFVDIDILIVVVVRFAIKIWGTFKQISVALMLLNGHRQ